MPSQMLALATGILIAVVLVLRLKARQLEETRWAYPLLLATFPIYYWMFAAYAGDSAALLKELLAGAGFFVIAFVAYRFRSFSSLLLLAVGYIAHAAYDFQHDAFFVNSGTPVWWPAFCGSIDFLLGAYLAYLAFSLRRRSVC